ncbi:alpha-amylase family glycosyl hydrolase [Hymenobacter sp. BRD67]|uniref:alpha-amylase family glycosyl hydrolase n=1 Tax=Hymenobacter sp. BRD67 TaxID=2675877 RepID=UPI001566D47C|nr:alpha-amylase family glycosyl hydrolase [Hymenobacter sp. BRD67]QKG51714.1 T9SS type A sorting domain-containing protein [Hymenobacter sp. BRD67]
MYVVGEFNNWQATSTSLMNKTSTVNTDATTGRWWIQVDGLTPGQEYAYQFLVDGQLRIADPYCEKILDPDNDPYINSGGYTVYAGLKPYPTGKATGIVSVLSPGEAAYTWTATNFQRPARTNLVIYELLMRDFVARHDYKTLRDTLNYIQRLGANAIELMPVNEFDGNLNWGYSPDFYFAPDKYYGTKNDLKALIDECHKRGIAIILDMVLNHSTGNSPMVQLYGNVSSGPTADNPWFNVTAPHPFSVYNDLNHESPYTRYFSKNVMKFWLQEYHIDGYRFDLSKGFTQFNSGGDVALWGHYDQSRINIWQDYYNTLVATDPTMYPILEHFADNNEEVVLSNMGLMLWGNMSGNYQQADKGKSGWDLSYGYYGGQGGRGWGKPNLVSYMESHDEERTVYTTTTDGNSSGSYSTTDPVTALKREELAAAIFFTQPGPRMISEFEELGYDISINQNGRTGNKPILWNYYQDPNRRHLYDTYRALIALRQQPVFASLYSAYTQNLTGAVKSIITSNANLGVVAFGNFDVVANSTTINFPQTGIWYNYLTGEQLNVTSASTTLNLQPGQYAVYTSRKIGVPAGTTLATRPQEAAVFKLSLAPNPAAGTTTLAYELPAAATTTVTVQNLLGQTVRQLAPARQTAGAQAQALSLQGLAPGMYLVKLQAGDLTQTARLLVQ